MDRVGSAEEKSLDLVQRVVISALCVVVFGAPTFALGAYAAFSTAIAPGDAIGLWVMCGVVGLLAAVAVLIINRRRPYSPLVLLGLLPAAVFAFWVF
ncbi:MAG TPA: hypothetical protein VFP34_13875 [Microlunatus sp.]|nr:hypothetical protein [Microlunatus sp.]